MSIEITLTGKVDNEIPYVYVGNNILPINMQSLRLKILAYI